MPRLAASLPAAAWRWLAVLVVVVAHLAAHAPAATPQHDDLVTLLLAAGGQDDWQTVVADPEWRTAGAYHDLVERSQPTPPTVVAAQVAHADIHPPLHWLLVSVWLPVAGRSLLVLLLTNVAIAGVLAWVVAGLARRCGAGEPLAAAVAVGVGVSPAVLMTSQELRLYLLAALVATMLAAWVVDVVVDETGDRVAARRWWQGVGLVALLALTGFAGVFVAAGAAIAVLATTPSRRRAARAVTAFPVGAGLALALWPHALDQVQRQTAQALPLFDELARRGGRASRTIASVVWPSASTAVAAVILLAVALLAAWAIRRRGRAVAALAVTAGIGLAGHLAFYLAGRVAVWAMSPKYLAFVLPLVLLVALLAARGTRGAVAVVVVMGTATILARAAVVGVLEDPPPSVVEDVDAVVVTNPRRGVGLRPLWHVPPYVAAVVGARHQLADLVDETPGCRALIVHNTQGGESEVTPDAFDGLFRADGWELEQVPPPTRRSRARLAVREGCG